MCLGIPAQLVALGDARARSATAELGGVRREVSTALLDGEPAVGEWVLVHVGFALQRVDEKEAQKTLALLEAMGDALERELAEIKESAA
jgi:hydrogenase expression/formation protein HypC